MPPKRRAPQPTTATKPARVSKLAKEHNITSSTESEIREAFQLFATPSASHEAALPTSWLPRALSALGCPPSPQNLPRLISSADPTSAGQITYATFLALAALALRNRSQEEEDREVEEAWRLFAGERDRITVGDLRRVAGVLKEKVADEVLRDMILEANGGGVGEGVRRGEFEGVMRRAGVFR